MRAKASLRLLVYRAAAYGLRPFLPRRPSPEGRPKILLMRPDHLGDVLFTTPALRALRQALPQAHLACLVGPWSKAVLEGNPHIDQIMCCPFPGFQRRPKSWLGEPYRTLWRYRRQLIPHQFDTAINLRFDFYWGALLAYVCGIPQRIGYDLPLCRPFLTHAIAYQPGQHEVFQNWRLVEEVVGRRLPSISGGLEFSPNGQARDFAARFLAERGVSVSSALVAIHPGSGAYIKRWTAEGFAAVADYLQRRHHATVVLTGSAQERELVEEIAAGMPSKPLLAIGQTALSQLAALFQRCRLVIGVDSGALHLGVAAGTPTVHLFGPSDPVAFGPYGDPQKHLVVRADYPCSPCHKLDFTPREAASHHCMRAITAEQVIEAAERLLSQREEKVLA